MVERATARSSLQQEMENQRKEQSDKVKALELQLKEEFQKREDMGRK